MVHLMNQQILNFQMDKALQRQEPVGAAGPAEMLEEIRTYHAMYVPMMLVTYLLERRRTQSPSGSTCSTGNRGHSGRIQALIDWLHMVATMDGAAAIKGTSEPAVPIMENQLQT
jgi:hypothetical protein